MNDAIKPGPETLSQAGLPELSVVVPTFNERDNVTVLYRRLEATLAGIAWEVVFVDDNSPDGTWEVVRGLARKDSRVRCIRRIGRRGLSGACIEGILASSGPYAAVIDADLQHDESQLPKMVALLRSGEAELVVGSRYIEGGSADSFNKQRAGASQLATEVARRALKVEVADPMSGFFMIRRDRFEQLAPQLSTQGFKILLDIIATAQGKLRTIEIPYNFGSRQHGESKLDSMVALDFLGLVLAKLTHDVVSLRFLLFAMVGGTGLVVHLAALFIAHEIFQEPFAEAQAAGALMGVVWNYAMSGLFVWRKR
ncbi:MAG TPA: glycosyltransferase family 2 protein [Burkholderiales bacterium]|nr:glycosyltransferase family 2 protein [Burkholderiales bacterium]